MLVCPRRYTRRQAPGFRRDGRVGALQAFAALAQQARPPGAPNAPAVYPAGGLPCRRRRPRAGSDTGGGAAPKARRGVEEEKEGRGRALTRGRRGSHLVVEPGEVGSEGRRDGFRSSRCCGEVLGRITALLLTGE